jgi:hypothetical protein
MKQVIILLTGICMSLTGLAQSDTTVPDQIDTIRVGGMIIIKKRSHNKDGEENKDVKIYRRSNNKNSRVSTNWFIIDLGFANYNDQTNYNSPAITDPNTGFAPGLKKDAFKLRAGKSVNVNIWFFMQRLGIVKKVVNLKYGLGLELNNYRYKEPIRFNSNPANTSTQVLLDNSTKYDKNKLAADYITVPLMLNFNFTPTRKRGFGFSAGASAGYLYSSRQKTITEADGKEKERDDFDLRPWKISYIGEISLGPVKLYGSYATQSMFEKGLDQQPYNVGLRLSNW